MALEIFDGRPGDGKTWSAMSLKILPHLARGGFVATNIEVNPDACGEWILQRTGKKWRPERLRVLTDEQVPEFYKHIPQGSAETQVLVVLDEVHLWFNARDWSKNDSQHREVFKLATQHRKYYLDVVLISQHFANIDSQFLRLVEKLWRFRDYSKWHVPGFPWLKVPFFRFRAVCYDRNGKTKLDEYWQPFSQLVGNTYNTRAVSKGGTALAGTVEDVKLEEDPAAAARVRKIQAWLNRGLMAAALVAVYFFSAWWSKRAALKEWNANQLAKGQTAVPAVVKIPKESGPSLASAFNTLIPERTVAAVEPKKTKTPSAFDVPPPVELIELRSYSGLKSNPTVSLDMDGYWQTLQRGSMTTRGRVMRMTQHGPRMWDVEISGAVGSPRILLRCVMKAPWEKMTPPAYSSGAGAEVTGPAIQGLPTTHKIEEL